jgi:carbonic anhydrase
MSKSQEVSARGPSSGWVSALSSDVPASLVVFLVALPLSMGISLASGAPIMSGLIAAVIGGLVVGVLGGAPLLVSGPAAGLAVMVFGFIQQFGFGATCAIVVAAGVLQITMGLLKVARISLAISPSVIHGMLAGIGILIVLGQLHVVLGGSPQSSAFKNIVELPGQIGDLHGAATVLGLLTIGILVAWGFMPSRLKSVPAQLVAVVGVTGIATFGNLDVPRVKLNGTLWDALQLPVLPDGQWGAVIMAVLSLAIVASAESLLSAVATDKLHAGARANLDRELFAQGVANALSGLVGGLPITGVIVRSAANISAGAKTRLSAILHGVWMLLFVSLLGVLITKVPLSVLAGLLVIVGVKLVNVAHIRELVRSGEGLIYFATVFGVVGINLLAGIGLGITLTILRLLWRLGRVRVHVKQQEGVHQVLIEGALTFVGVPELTSSLQSIPRGAHVRLDLSVETLDHSGYEALHSWCQTHQKMGGVVETEMLEDIWHRSSAPKSARTSPRNSSLPPMKNPSHGSAVVENAQ